MRKQSLSNHQGLTVLKFDRSSGLQTVKTGQRSSDRKEECAIPIDDRALVSCQIFQVRVHVGKNWMGKVGERTQTFGNRSHPESDILGHRRMLYSSRFYSFENKTRPIWLGLCMIFQLKLLFQLTFETKSISRSTFLKSARSREMWVGQILDGLCGSTASVFGLFCFYCIIALVSLHELWIPSQMSCLITGLIVINFLLLPDFPTTN